MPGILEVISFMLAFGGVGVDANSKAPSADAVLAYAVDDADAVVQLDVAAVGPRNYKVLVGLADDPAVKASPEMLGMAKQIKANLEGVRGMAKSFAGIDPVNDITSVTVFVDLGPDGKTHQMAVARGTFPADFVKKLSGVAGGTAGTIDGRATLEMDPETFLGTAKDGALIVGPKAWVTPRVDDDWKPAKRAKGSAWAMIAKELDDKPFFMVAAKMDEKTAAGAAKEIGDNFAGDLVAGHEVAIIGLHHDGLSIVWKDRTKAGMERVAQLADGTVELMRAAQIAPRGFVKIVLAALDSYKGKDKELDVLIAHKDDLAKLVEQYTGDGNFKVKSDKDGKARTFTLRATGKTLSDVVPVAMLVPAIGAGMWMSMSGSPSEMPVASPPPRPVTRSGGGVQKAPTKPAPAKPVAPPKKK